MLFECDFLSLKQNYFSSCFILLAQSKPTKKQKAKGLQKHIFYKKLFLSSANTLFSSLDYSSINQKNYRIWSSFFLYIIFYRIFFINNLPRSFASRNHTQHYWSLIYTCNSFSWFFFLFSHTAPLKNIKLKYASWATYFSSYEFKFSSI